MNNGADLKEPAQLLLERFTGDDARRRTLFIGEQVKMFVLVKHPKLSLDFLSHVEVKIVPTVVHLPDGDSSEDKKKMPWYSVEHDAYFWNGRAVTLKHKDLLSNSIGAVFDDLICNFSSGYCLIPLDLHMKEHQLLTQYREDGSKPLKIEIAVSLLWKPTSKINVNPVDSLSDSTDGFNVSSSIVKRPGDLAMDNLSRSLNKFAFISGMNEHQDEINLPFSPSTQSPVRRTIKQNFESFIPFAVTATLSNLSNENEQLTAFLQFDILNVTKDDILIIEDVGFEGACSFSLESLNSLSHETVYAHENMAYLFKLTIKDQKIGFLSRLNNPHSVINDEINGLKIKINGRLDSKLCGFVNLKTEFVLSLDENGELSLRSGNIQSQLRDSSETEANAPSGQEGVVITFTPPPIVFVNKTFLVNIIVTNHSEKSQNLRLSFARPLETVDDDIVEPGYDYPVYMDPESFFDMYEKSHSHQSAILPLDSNINLSKLAPNCSTTVQVHFIAMRGAGTRQSIDVVQCINDDNGKIVEIYDPFEVMIKE